MRRFLKIFAVVIAILVIAVALSPYWLPAPLPLIARRLGATYESYSRLGYGRFALNNVTVRRRGVTVTVTRVEADTPWLWALRHARKADRTIIAEVWKVEVVEHPATEPRERHEPGWVPLRDQLVRIADQLERWLPNARVGRGQIRWPTGELALDHADWGARTLRADGLRWKDDAADVVVSFPAREIRLEAKLTTRPVSVRAESQSGSVDGELRAWDQPAPFDATFNPSGWMPTAAHLALRNWRVEGPMLKLEKAYSQVQGSAQLAWEQGRFSVDADVRGQPAEARGAPELRVLAHAEGDRTSYQVERLDLSAPGITAKLSEPIRANFREGTAGPASRFTFDANLAEVPWFRAEGKVVGEVRVEPRPSAAPVFQFTASGESLGFGHWRGAFARTEGQLDWPKLVIRSAELTATESRLALSGECDFRAKTLTGARVEGLVTPAIAQPFLPKTIGFRSAEVALMASGPWATLHHEGAVKVEQLTVPGFTPAAARAWWRGDGPEISEAETGIHAGATELVLNGSANRESARVSKLVWRQQNQERLALERPATVHWLPGLQVDAFDLVGPAGELRFSGRWGASGELKFFARGIAAAWWRDFVPDLPFDWSIDHLSAQAAWDKDQPATATASGKVFLDLPGRASIAVELGAKTDAKGLVIDQLRALEQDREFATAQGKLPIALWLGPKPRVDLARAEDLAIKAHVDPSARWWTELGQRTGIRFDQPDLTLQLDGSWEQPRGSARLSVVRLAIDRRVGTAKWPTIENIRLQLIADGSQLKLQPLEAAIEGQPVALSATMPTNRETWTKLRKDPVAVLRDEVEVNLRAANVDVAAWAPYASGALLPQGRLDADLTLSIRGDWKGHLRIHDLATRPLGSLSPLRDISADLELQGREARLNSAQASYGGRPLNVTGTVDFPVGGSPRFDLTAKGENLPFVRQSGLIVRGDVNIQVTNTRARGVPTVSGDVQLRDSLFLADVRALVPHGGGASAERRPPYFSVNQEPFNRWRLDLNVHGERFLRARTTLFNGVATMKFHLVGTLGEPRALGEVRVEDGQVMFPFARFSLRDASVRLTEENPYDPQLAVFGSSRRYGYDINLELTGSASAPNLVFSSNPPLNAEQVLLLVMAGQTPKNEVTYSTNQRFARLGTYFGESLLGSLNGGEGSDRLTISSGEQVSVEGRETYDVEYKLNHRWALVGEYDEFDEYNVGLKYRLLPKKLRGEENESR